MELKKGFPDGRKAGITFWLVKSLKEDLCKGKQIVFFDPKASGVVEAIKQDEKKQKKWKGRKKGR